MRLIFFFFCLLLTQSGQAQLLQPPPTPGEERISSFAQRKALEQASLLNGIEWRSIGPTIMSGRVTDIDVSPTDPTHFYVAYASGGLWKTVNNGHSFTPLFDQEMAMTIGDIAVDWARNTIWVGTGEVNSSRSSYAGTGIFKSTNGGKTWQHLGLGESHHIGRIILHPTNPDIAWVAVLGHLYSPNKERGVYKTTDGGKTWKQTLFVNENAGAVDLIMEPSNPRVLYAAAWERERRAWNFVEGGQGTGIYKSTDGGDTWKLLTNASSGFPQGELVGRIGLSAYKGKGQTVLYAAVDNYNLRPKADPDPDVVTREMLREMSTEDFLKLPKYQVAEYLQSNGFPRTYSADKVIDMVKKNEIKPVALVEYVEDANSILLSSTVIGLEIYKSTDGGKTWAKTHKDLLDAYSSYGYYFGMVHVSPVNPNKVYTYGVPILRSDDGGKTWINIDNDNVHADHHALWINPRREGHLINGNDGGLNISYDDGKTWIKCNTPPVGQFYAVAVDMAKPYNVYGGLQDNGVWMGPSNYRSNTGWHASGQYPYKSLLGGDGMQVAVDTRDNATVYTGFQFGNYSRINTKTNERKRITPQPQLGERPLRWNWQSPIHLSIHNQDILYMGSNKLHRSFNQGDDFTEISADLTKGGRKGDVAFGTLTTIHESPLKFGLLYTGSDDGLVHFSPDGGHTWRNVTAGLPQDMWVSRVQASAHVESRVYVALNGYRWDDFTSYLYVSEDYGKTWRKIGNDLPLEPVNVVREDPANANILYVGTDHGLYVSVNRGINFMLWNKGLPAAPVHDLVIQNRDKEILVGTHGRSLYTGNIRELQQLTAELMDKPLVIFNIEKQRHNPRWGFSSWWGELKPAVKIPLYANSAGKINGTVSTAAGLPMATFTAEVQPGLNYPEYDLSFEEALLEDYNQSLNEKRKPDEKPLRVTKADNGKYYLHKGTYKLLIEKDGQVQETTIVIE
ncbi:MAG TPA: glycosyl hydrolase [Saprospiraceae bacterium]|nr:glycosyl hydrolase [Saprospiraceae bacterium]HMP24054.1 glycosyl hydrolase [Saprospiraceae bacterium]